MCSGKLTRRLIYLLSSRSLAALLAILGLLFGASAGLPAEAATIPVTSCNASDLIAAINTANASPDADVIELAAGCRYDLVASGYTDPVEGPSALAIAPGTVTINGNGATIQRHPSLAGPFRIFRVASGAVLNLDRITVRYGWFLRTLDNGMPSQGAGILNRGKLVLTNSTIAGNAAGQGAGIFNAFGATAIVDRSTVSSNQATLDSGGGIYNEGALTVNNSTLARNAVLLGDAGYGGAIFNNNPDGPVTVRNSTVAGNSALYGAGISNTGPTTVSNTIIANNGSWGANCHGDPLGGANNLIWSAADTSCGPSFAAGDPKLSVLRLNGGFTETAAPQWGSAAIDAGDNASCLASDQRGVARPVDGDFDGAAVCDIGAVEAVQNSLIDLPVFAVNSTADTDDGNCDASNCTLREAIHAANNWGRYSVISLAPSASYTLNVTDSSGPDVGLPPIFAPIRVEGNGATIARSPAAPAFRIFRVGAGGWLELDRVAVRGGFVRALTGGGIENRGTLRVSDSTISGNRAQFGGGIGNVRNATAIVEGSSISGNIAEKWGSIPGDPSGGGGGIFNPAYGALSVTNSTIVGNSTSTFGGNPGGGIANGGTLAVANSTIVGNLAGSDAALAFGGGLASDGPTTVRNTIIANNGPGTNCTGALVGGARGTLVAGGDHNLVWPVSDTSCGAGFAAGDPKLGPLQGNGGTDTMAPVAGSAAIDTGDDSSCPPTDQRGVVRPIDADDDGNAVCDIGAVEAPVVPGIAALTPATAVAAGPAFTLSVSGSRFRSGAVVRWYDPVTANSTDLATSVVSPVELSAAVPAALQAAPKTVEITVVNPAPDGSTSQIELFYVTQKPAGLINSEVATGAGGAVAVSIGGSGSGTPDSLSASATGSGTMGVAQYDANPGGTPSFRAANSYFDVFVAPGSTFNEVTVVACNLGGGMLVYWWNDGVWALASRQTYNQSSGCVTVVVDATTTPNIAQLAGTIFGAGYPPDEVLPPSATFVYPAEAVTEGSTFSIALANPWQPGVSHPVFQYAFDCGAGYGTTGPIATTSCVALDNPTQLVRARIIGANSLSSEYVASIAVANVPPTITEVAGPAAAVLAGTPISITASFHDPGSRDTHTATVRWGDGTETEGTIVESNGRGTVRGEHAYDTPGIYSVTLVVSDKDGETADSTFRYVIVYRAAGSLTGHTFVDTPGGRARLDLNVWYRRGESVPTGALDFRIQGSKPSLVATKFDWLAIDGARALLRGVGKAGGGEPRAFLLSVVDGQTPGGSGADKARLKIWDPATGAVVFDSQPLAPDDATPQQTIRDGSITIGPGIGVGQGSAR